eukprot:gene4002-biopygen12874
MSAPSESPPTTDVPQGSETRRASAAQAWCAMSALSDGFGGAGGQRRTNLRKSLAWSRVALGRHKSNRRPAPLVALAFPHTYRAPLPCAAAQICQLARRLHPPDSRCHPGVT